MGTPNRSSIWGELGGGNEAVAAEEGGGEARGGGGGLVALASRPRNPGLV
jgi:hypothetical protein